MHSSLPEMHQCWKSGENQQSGFQDITLTLKIARHFGAFCSKRDLEL